MPLKTKLMTRRSYFTLVKRFPLIPIRDDAHLSQASAMIDVLLQRDLDEDESDYLEVLSDLVQRYEQQHHPLPKASPPALLRFLLEERELSQAQLARTVGIAPSVISEFLSGTRELSKANIQVLAKFFGVSPAVFVPK